MFSNSSDNYRRLLFALFAMLLLALTQPARAADYTAGVASVNGAPTLWMQGASITQSIAHYNINGAPQQNVAMLYSSARARYELPLTAAGGQTVNYSFTYTKAGLAYDSPWAATVIGGNDPDKVATPAFTPPGGSYSSAQQVVVSSATAGATVFCSVNGAPAAVCPGPLSISANSTVSAYATKSGLSNSDSASATYSFAGTGISHGVQDNGSSLTVWFAQAPRSDWVDLHYTLNGGGQQNVSMTWSGTRHELNLPVAPGAAAVNYNFTYMTATGARDSAWFSWSRDGERVAAPTISPAGGSFTESQSVTLASATTGASIRYTLNGAEPTATSTLYSGAFTLAAPGATVKAAAFKTGMNPSSVSSALFSIGGGKVLNPSFAPAGGTYSAAQTVQLSSATGGAAIWYAVNGGAQQLYSSPISVAATSTITAVAKKSGMSDSAPVSASYTINGGEPSFVHGVAEDGALARIWYAPNWTPSTSIIHYYVTGSDGAKSPQRDENMVFDSALGRWQSPSISPVASGMTISYFFTYSQSTGGNRDSALFHYRVCGDDAPTSPECPNPVPKPVFNPAVGGVFDSPQSVSLAPGAGSPAGTVIYYTLDASAPTVRSRQYTGTPIAVTSATTITAIAVQADGQQSRRASLTFDIRPSCTQTPAGCTVAAPVMSHAGGSYSTRIGVNMLTSTTGASVHYTRDGSTPSAASPRFHGAIWLAKSDQYGDTFTLKAIAVKNGVSSDVTSATYKILANNESLWNGRTVFNVVNGTGGKYTDDKVYWLIIGKDWSTGNFVRADMNGNLIAVTEADNTVPVPGRDKGYANYAITLAQAKSVTIPPIESARIYMSVGKPVLVQINRDINGKIGYAGPDLENSTDPNLGVTFDFGEFNINRPRPASDYPGIFVNTTRVDIFGFPLKLRVTGLDGYDATVGETLEETREQLFARFLLETPEQFHGLAKAPYAPLRIMAPAHGTFNDGLNVQTGAQVKPRGPNADYLDAYIGEVWDMYRSRDLVMKVGDWPAVTGRVGADNVLTFTDGIDTYKIYDKPSTTEVMLGNGVLDDATGTNRNGSAAEKLKHDKQLQLQAQLCAALNRRVAHQPWERWYDSAFFYPAGERANFFTKFWHDHSYNGLAYGFSYDDVGGHSPSIYTPAPVSVTYTIGQ